MGSLSQREKILLLITFILLIGVGYYFFIFTPAQEEIARLEQRLIQEEDDLFRDQIMARRLPDLEETYAEKRWMVDSLEASLPDQVRVSDFLDDLEQIARRLELRFQTFRPQSPETPSDYYGTKKYRLTVQGPFDRVLLFLIALEEFQQPLEIEQIRMSATGERGWVNVETHVISYFLL